MRWVLRDVTVLLWVALSIAYALTQTFWGVFAITFVPTLPVALILIVAYPLTVGVLFVEVFKRGRT